MHDTIYLSYSWQDIPVAKLTTRLTNRFFGPLRWLVLILSVIVLFSTYTLLREHVFTDEGSTQMSTLLSAVASSLMLGIGATLGHKRLQAAMMQAPIRQKDCALAINRHGIAAEGGALHAQVDWADVTEIVELGAFVLVMLSPLEYVPIPVFALPPDMEREDLIEQLRTWHQAAVDAEADVAFA